MPTYKDVLKQYFLTREIIKTCQESNKEPTFGDIAPIVILDVHKLWEKASIPTLSHRRILEMLKTFHAKYRNNLKTKKARKSYQLQVDSLLQDSEALFDICSCNCKVIYKCSCETPRKIPRIEVPFLLDQRTDRNMTMSGIDNGESNRIQKRIAQNKCENTRH